MCIRDREEPVAKAVTVPVPAPPKPKSKPAPPKPEPVVVDVYKRQVINEKSYFLAVFLGKMLLCHLEGFIYTLADSHAGDNHLSLIHI